MRRLRAGDGRAFAEFAERYVPVLYRFAHRRLDGDGELTREVVQSTMCRVIAKLDGYRGEAPLATWLCACCRNEIAAHFRRLGRRPREVELDAAAAREDGGRADASRPGAPPGPEERLLRLENAELVHATLDLLPPAYARAVEWRYLEGVEVGEIARRLGSSYKAAESVLSRGRKAFRTVFERLGGEGRGGGEQVGKERARERPAVPSSPAGARR